MSIRRIPFFLLITFSVLFSGCTTDDSMSGNMPEGKLISLTVPANYHSSYPYVNYFVSSLADGGLIHSQKVNSDVEVLFEAEQDENSVLNRYDLSRCFIRDNGSYKSITINTYIGILPFSLELKTTPSKYLGDAYVKFTNVPSYNSFMLACSFTNITSGTLSTTTFSIPLFSDIPKGLFIRLSTAVGDLYKFVDNLVAGQTTTISLSGMSNDFSIADILLSNDNFDYLHLEVARYPENDFSSGSYCVFSSSVSGSVFTYTYPLSFLSNKYSRTYLYGSSIEKYSWCISYSEGLAASFVLLDGEVTDKSNIPENISYNLDLNDKADVLILSWSHNSTFRDAYGFRVSWTFWVSPSVRDFKLPDIPDEILNFLSDNYGIDHLQLELMEPGSAGIYQNGRAGNFDDWIQRYWLGWEDPKADEADKYLNVMLSAKKNDSEPGKSEIFPVNLNPTYNY